MYESKFYPAMTVAERAKKRTPFARMIEAKEKLALASGTVRHHLGRLDDAVRPQSKLAAAIEVEEVVRVRDDLRMALKDVEHWIDQYILALGDSVTEETAKQRKKK